MQEMKGKVTSVHRQRTGRRSQEESILYTEKPTLSLELSSSTVAHSQIEERNSQWEIGVLLLNGLNQKTLVLFSTSFLTLPCIFFWVNLYSLHKLKNELFNFFYYSPINFSFFFLFFFHFKLQFHYLYPFFMICQFFFKALQLLYG